MVDDLPTGELCDRYGGLYTGVIADVLDECGFTYQTIRDGIRPLDLESSVVGVAFTAVGRRNSSVDPEEQIRRLLRMLGEVERYRVLVMETNDTVAAHMGELMTTALTEQGACGAVLDGGTRDTEFIIDQGFPVFTGYVTPKDSIPRWELLSWDVDIVLGGVEISPGDVVVGDADGTVVVPNEIAEAVLETAEERTAEEDKVRTAIKDGATPLEAYEKYGVF